MPPAKRFDHVGVTVSDLEAAVSFFRLIGLEPDAEPFVVEGHFVSTVVGIEDTRVLNVTVEASDGGWPGCSPTLGHPACCDSCATQELLRFWCGFFHLVV